MLSLHLPIALLALLPALSLSAPAPLPQSLTSLLPRADDTSTTYIYVRGDTPPQIALNSLPSDPLPLPITLSLLTDFATALNTTFTSNNGAASYLNGKASATQSNLKAELAPAGGDNGGPQGYNVEPFPQELARSVPVALKDFFELQGAAFGITFRVVDDTRKVVFAVGKLTGK